MQLLWLFSVLAAYALATLVHETNPEDGRMSGTLLGFIAFMLLIVIITRWSVL